jgi:hypothetical protein
MFWEKYKKVVWFSDALRNVFVKKSKTYLWWEKKEMNNVILMLCWDKREKIGGKERIENNLNFELKREQHIYIIYNHKQK